MFIKTKTMKSINSFSAQTEQLAGYLSGADAVIIGAGAGLSVSAGYTYSGKRFEDNFSDFIRKYGFKDMYSAGFYPYDTLEEFWAYWSRYIYLNRYVPANGTVYNDLYEIVKDMDYFVLTTNVDHAFQKSGFDKHRLFYTQGDYGLWQCSRPCCQKTYDNEEAVRRMVLQQKDMRIPSGLVPYCPVCGSPLSMNLRCDETFVQDAGWYRAQEQYQAFLHNHARQSILFLELGVGGNTPSIIKYPFWQMASGNPRARYACINLGEAYCPGELASRSVCIDSDIGEVCNCLLTFSKPEL